MQGSYYLRFAEILGGDISRAGHAESQAAGFVKDMSAIHIARNFQGKRKHFVGQ